MERECADVGEISRPKRCDRDQEEEERNVKDVHVGEGEQDHDKERKEEHPVLRFLDCLYISSAKGTNISVLRVDVDNGEGAQQKYKQLHTHIQKESLPCGNIANAPKVHDLRINTSNRVSQAC